MSRAIEDILSGNQESVEPTETVTEAATGVETPKPRDEKGRFAPKADDPSKVEGAQPKPEGPQAEALPDKPKEETQPSDPEADPKNWTYAAYKDEKSKRQEYMRRAQAAEQRAQELEAHFQQLKKQQEQKPPPDQFADPEGYNAYWEQRLQAQEQSIQERTRALEGNFSLRLAHNKHGETFEKAFAELMSVTQGGDDSVRQSVLNSPDPGETLVQWYKRQQVLQEVGDDPAGYREKLKEQLKSELMAELGTQAPAQQQPAVQFPTNLESRRSVGSRTGPAWGGPQPIADILARKK